jgi:lysophospholipase
MGGVILLEAVRQGRRWFDRIVLTSPMIDLAVRARELRRWVAQIGALIGLGRLYVPGGSRHAEATRPFLDNPFTSDAVRYERIVSIIEAAPELALGSPTIDWAHAAFQVMDRLRDPAYPATLRQPMLLIAAGSDNVVSTPAIARFAIRLRAGAHLVIPASRHEILMERDVFRTQFWAAFDAFIPGSQEAGAPL